MPDDCQPLAGDVLLSSFTYSAGLIRTACYMPHLRGIVVPQRG